MDMGNREFHTLLGAMLDNYELFNSLAEPRIAELYLKKELCNFGTETEKNFSKQGTNSTTKM